MKISLLTSVLNCRWFIAQCIASVKEQRYPFLEHVIFDGGSTDGTLDIIRNTIDDRAVVFSEADHGFYDGLNKGLKYCTGDIIGIINADDSFYNRNVISEVARCFQDKSVGLVYGNIYYVKRNQPEVVTRVWKSGYFSLLKYHLGWVPPHTAVFFRKSLIEDNVEYLLNYGVAADYQLLLRLLQSGKLKLRYLDAFLVVMRDGGMSNGSISKYARTLIDDYRALKSVDFPNPLAALIGKRVQKLKQFV